MGFWKLIFLGLELLIIKLTLFQTKHPENVTSFSILFWTNYLYLWNRIYLLFWEQIFSILRPVLIFGIVLNKYILCISLFHFIFQDQAHYPFLRMGRTELSKWEYRWFGRNLDFLVLWSSFKIHLELEVLEPKHDKVQLIDSKLDHDKKFSGKPHTWTNFQMQMMVLIRLGNYDFRSEHAGYWQITMNCWCDYTKKSQTV